MRSGDKAGQTKSMTQSTKGQLRISDMRLLLMKKAIPGHPMLGMRLQK